MPYTYYNTFLPSWKGTHKLQRSGCVHAQIILNCARATDCHVRKHERLCNSPRGWGSRNHSHGNAMATARVARPCSAHISSTARAGGEELLNSCVLSAASLPRTIISTPFQNTDMHSHKTQRRTVSRHKWRLAKTSIQCDSRWLSKQSIGGVASKTV